MPSPPPRNFQAFEGGSVWVSNGLLVWSIFDLGGGGGMQYSRSCFQARRHLHPMCIGGYCSL